MLRKAVHLSFFSLPFHRRGPQHFLKLLTFACMTLASVQLRKKEKERTYPTLGDWAKLIWLTGYVPSWREVKAGIEAQTVEECLFPNMLLHVFLATFTIQPRLACQEMEASEWTCLSYINQVSNQEIIARKKMFLAPDMSSNGGIFSAEIVSSHSSLSLYEIGIKETI